MKKILVIRAFRDRVTGEVRTPATEYDYEDERAEELVAGGWAKLVEEPVVEPEVIEEPEPVEEKKTKGFKTKKKKK